MKGEQRQAKELAYLFIYPDDYDSQKQCPIVILLHGFGASMQDLAGLTPSIDSTGYIYVCPNAPIEVDIGPSLPGYSPVGYSWVPPRESATPEDIENAQGILERYYAEMMQEHNISPQNAILLGFSQGGSMTYRTGLSRPDLFAGAVVLSIGFPEDARQRLPQERTLPIFVGHGTQDNIERGREAKEILESEGYSPRYEEYPMGHEISQHVLDDLIPWLHETLPPFQP